MMSVNCRAQDILKRTEKGHVFAVFKNTLLLDCCGELVAWVTPDYGPGPFHIVVQDIPSWDLGTFVSSNQFGVFPPPYWNASILPFIKPYQDGSELFPFLKTQDGGGFREKISTELAALSHSFRESDLSQMKKAIHGIAGLGPGLTPSGDDFISGMIFGLWLFKKNPNAWISVLAQESLDRTNRISQAFLRSAERGEFDARWHALLHAVSENSSQKIEQALRAIYNYGHSSGKDMLDGLHWIIKELHDGS